jgi:hypothetical protein
MLQDQLVLNQKLSKKLKDLLPNWYESFFIWQYDKDMKDCILKSKFQPDNTMVDTLDYCGNPSFQGVTAPTAVELLSVMPEFIEVDSNRCYLHIERGIIQEFPEFIGFIAFYNIEGKNKFISKGLYLVEALAELFIKYLKSDYGKSFINKPIQP